MYIIDKLSLIQGLKELINNGYRKKFITVVNTQELLLLYKMSTSFFHETFECRDI